MGETLMVGMAEVKITKSPDDVLVALGLGSCIGICAYDAQARVAGMVHVVLPDSAGFEANLGKFADTAVPLLLEEMQKRGASLKNIRVALAGGAQLFAFNGSGGGLEIGPRNAAAVETHLKQRNISVLCKDVGGSVGRTVHLFADGRVRVKTIGQGERDLVALGPTAETKTTPPPANEKNSPERAAWVSPRLSAARASGR